MMHDSFFFFAFYLFYLVFFFFYFFFFFFLAYVFLPFPKQPLFVVCIFFLPRTRWGWDVGPLDS